MGTQVRPTFLILITSSSVLRCNADCTGRYVGSDDQRMLSSWQWSKLRIAPFNGYIRALPAQLMFLCHSALLRCTHTALC